MPEPYRSRRYAWIVPERNTHGELARNVKFVKINEQGSEHDTVLDTTQSVLGDMTIHEYRRHAQGHLHPAVSKDTIIDMIWIR